MSGTTNSERSTMFRRPLLVFGIPLLLLAAVFVGLRLQTPTLLRQVARDYHAFRSDEPYLEMLTTDGGLLEEFFVHRGVDFETRVPDLSSMRFTLEGGRVHALTDRLSTAVVYTGPQGEFLLGQTFRGAIEELPRGATRHEHDGIKFHVYRRSGLSLVFRQEGAVLRVLVSDIDAEKLVQLALAGAGRIAPGP